MCFFFKKKEETEINDSDQWRVLKAAPSTELHLLTLAPSVFIQRDAVLATIYLQPDSIISRVVFAVVCFLFFKFHASVCSALFWITLNMLHGCNADAVWPEVLLVVRRAPERLGPPVETMQTFGFR